MIVKFCKFYTINKKFTEFLFINLKGKSDIFDKKVRELKEELFNLKFQAALGNLEKPARMNEIKRTIARLKTVLNEREGGEK